MADLMYHKQNIEMAFRLAKEDGFIPYADAEEGMLTLDASAWRYDMYRDERSEKILGVEFI